ncbi:MAG: hypothetical protein QOJ50_2599, partial [Cryptosporangiaceae bacterium]|nr:hypothetical protein [Cryptosporangiaceae bacterium]
MSNVAVLAVGSLYALAVLAGARFWGIAYAIPIGVAGMVALDWYYIPPTHTSIVPGREDAIALVLYLVTGVLLGELAAGARRRADAEC